jgi:hypothetical protein
VLISVYYTNVSERPLILEKWQSDYILGVSFLLCKSFFLVIKHFVEEYMVAPIRELFDLVKRVHILLINTKNLITFEIFVDGNCGFFSLLAKL